MAKVKYYAKENSSIGTHSFYAVPIPNGTLTFDELLDEAMDGKSVEPSIATRKLSEQRAQSQTTFELCRVVTKVTNRKRLVTPHQQIIRMNRGNHPHESCE